MRHEHKIPPLLVAGLVVLVLAIGALAYYAGRFGRLEGPPSDDAAVELPPPAPPDPAVVIPTPAEVPPTVTPAAAVLIERETRTTRAIRSSPPLVERSSQIDVPVPAVIPTAAIRGTRATPLPTPRRQIIVEVVSSPVPQPTPTPEEVEPEEVEEGDEEENRPTPHTYYPTPTPEPESEPPSRPSVHSASHR